MSKSTTNDISIVALILSILLSVLIISQRQPFSVDGILYLDTAKIYLNDGLRAAMKHYAWPFYSLLIAELSYLTHLTLLHSAYLLNTLLISLIVWSYLRLIVVMGGNRQTLWIATIVILGYPFLSHYRNGIIRDFGYYAFALLSLLYFIRYFKDPHWRYALLWWVSLVVATLFRIEGGILLLFAPLVLLLHPSLSLQHRLVKILQLHSMSIIGVLFVIVYHYVYSLPNQALGRIPEIFHQLRHADTLLLTTIKQKAQAMQSVFADSYAAGSETLFMYGGLFFVFMRKFINTFTLFYLGLIAYLLYARKIPATIYSLLPIGIYLLLNLCIIMGFLTQYLFLSARYIGLFCFILLLFAPFALQQCWQMWAQHKFILSRRTLIYPGVAIGLLIITIGSIGHFGTSKSFIIDAGQWMQAHTSENSKVLSNDAQLMYWVQRPPMQYNDEKFMMYYRDRRKTILNMRQIAWRDYDYLALLIPRDMSEQKKYLAELIKQAPLMSFYNKEGDQIVIFSTRVR